MPFSQQIRSNLVSPVNCLPLSRRRCRTRSPLRCPPLGCPRGAAWPSWFERWPLDPEWADRSQRDPRGHTGSPRSCLSGRSQNGSSATRSISRARCAPTGAAASAERDEPPRRATIQEAVRPEGVGFGPEVGVAVGQVGRVQHHLPGGQRDTGDRRVVADGPAAEPAGGVQPERLVQHEWQGVRVAATRARRRGATAPRRGCARSCRSRRRPPPASPPPRRPVWRGWRARLGPDRPVAGIAASNRRNSSGRGSSGAGVARCSGGGTERGFVGQLAIEKCLVQHPPHHSPGPGQRLDGTVRVCAADQIASAGAHRRVAVEGGVELAAAVVVVGHVVLDDPARKVRGEVAQAAAAAKRLEVTQHAPVPVRTVSDDDAPPHDSRNTGPVRAPSASSCSGSRVHRQRWPSNGVAEGAGSEVTDTAGPSTRRFAAAQADRSAGRPER